MPGALPHTGRISQDFSKQVEYKSRKVQFGNGYKEISPDGINNKVENWTLNYEAMTDSEYSALIAILDAAEHDDYVTWTPFGEVSSKNWYVVGPRSETYSNGHWNVSINLETYR